MDFFWNVIHFFRLGRQEHSPPLLYVRDGVSGVQQFGKAEDIPPKADGSVRLVLMSDTHTRHDLATCPPGDVLLYAGDIVFSGRRLSNAAVAHHYRQFNSWLEQVPCAHKVVIAGNHDRYLEEIGAEASAQLLSNAIYLANSSVTLHGLSFFGSPVNRGSSQNSAFQSATFLSQFHAALMAEESSGPVDVLLTHGPLPRQEVAQMLPRVQLHSWGHFHARHGVRVEGKDTRTWLSVCACILDGHYEATQGAVVCDLPRPS